jgi:hypothetical protein
VRWFHPSDAAAAVDWNQFAVDGVRRIMELRDGQRLRATLSELFAPFAPTVQITASPERFREPALPGSETAGLEQVAWEHQGFGDSTFVSVYASKRRHRERVAPVPGMPSASLSQSVDRSSPNEGWNVMRDSSDPASGSSSLRIERAMTSDSTELFSDAPEPGEATDIDLGSGLRARIPLVLPSRDGRTLGDQVAPSTAQTSAATALQADFDVAAGIADVIIVWNALQHFWPYWDVVPTDWYAALDVALADAADDGTISEHVATLERLTAGAPDAHIRMTCRGEPETVDPPFAVEVIENKVVVTTTATDQVVRGDVITTIAGERAEAHLQAQQALVSGSPQWRRLRASQRFGMGAPGSSVTLGIVRDGAPLAITVKRGTRPPSEFAYPSIHRFGDGVYYIDLSRAESAEIDAVLDQVAAAPGVVFGECQGCCRVNHAAA